MADRSTTVNRIIEGVLGTGVTVSGLLLLAGLVLGENRLLAAGIVLLMATPLLRVLVLTAALFIERDWLFALVSLAVLTVLTTSVLWAIRAERASSSLSNKGVLGRTPLEPRSLRGSESRSARRPVPVAEHGAGRG